MKNLEFNLRKLLVWINLRDVLLELYTNLGISYNLSAFGNPLDVDGVIVGLVIPRAINVVLKDRSTKSILGDVPWLPKWCFKGCTFGHVE
ncbi:hypothetical protein PVK06_018776 [Gossypium arboreum]|uniref:Uncharacterized protein n=1 Tax=Gossypium arboreum TaxID=29729 RepID=A0ABR0PI23_GOSAR|nr:hypothetical protein PVK06_018776 [Gossypium arboreum]